ncbi:MAG: N-acetylmuramoyl-L-alanine amidase [Gammaproteobacteria bacterium]
MVARLLLILVFALSAPVNAAADGANNDASLQGRLWLLPERARLVIETGAELDYKVFQLDNPPRIVMDVYSSADSPKGLDSGDLTDTDASAYLRAFRHSPRFDGDRLRFVFDLSGDVKKPRVSYLAPVAGYRWRLILDVLPKNAPDPLLPLLLQLEEKEAPPFLVVIDPGHGGEDPGAVSPNNNYEKKVVLAIAKQLREELNAESDIRAELTRSKDRFLKLGRRVNIAHRLGADVFISVHADSVVSRKVQGASVFVLSEKGASSSFARRLARHANLSDLVGGEISTAEADPAVSAALRQLSKDGKNTASRQLAELILRNIGGINKLHSDRVESAGFAVLKSPSIPSVLVETAFISNPEEEKKLLAPAFQKRMAEAIADAVKEYKMRHHTP